jgi:hypothetical protein
MAWKYQYTYNQQIPLASNTTAGIVKGSATGDGKVFVEDDLTLSTIGFDAVKSKANTAYQKPATGIPDGDIASASTWNNKQTAITSGTSNVLLGPSSNGGQPGTKALTAFAQCSDTITAAQLASVTELAKLCTVDGQVRFFLVLDQIITGIGAHVYGIARAERRNANRWMLELHLYNHDNIDADEVWTNTYGSDLAWSGWVRLAKTTDFNSYQGLTFPGVMPWASGTAYNKAGTWAANIDTGSVVIFAIEGNYNDSYNDRPYHEICFKVDSNKVVTATSTWQDSRLWYYVVNADNTIDLYCQQTVHWYGGVEFKRADNRSNFTPVYPMTQVSSLPAGGTLVETSYVTPLRSEVPIFKGSTNPFVAGTVNQFPNMDFEWHYNANGWTLGSFKNLYGLVNVIVSGASGEYVHVFFNGFTQVGGVATGRQEISLHGIWKDSTGAWDTTTPMQLAAVPLANTANITEVSLVYGSKKVATVGQAFASSHMSFHGTKGTTAANEWACLFTFTLPNGNDSGSMIVDIVKAFYRADGLSLRLHLIASNVSGTITVTAKAYGVLGTSGSQGLTYSISGTTVKIWMRCNGNNPENVKYNVASWRGYGGATTPVDSTETKLDTQPGVAITII